MNQVDTTAPNDERKPHRAGHYASPAIILPQKLLAFVRQGQFSDSEHAGYATMMLLRVLGNTLYLVVCLFTDHVCAFTSQSATYMLPL